MTRDIEPPDHIPDWMLAGEEPPTEPDELWPEDVISKDEWKRAWFDRQTVNGRPPRRTAWGWTTEEQP